MTYIKQTNRNRHPGYLNYIEISITEHCNLNCAHCSNFSPLAEEHFADLIIFENSIEKLSLISKGMIDEIRLIGGEPLLNSKILEYFEIIKKHLPITKLSFFTNGILFPTQEEAFMRYLKINKVKVFISDYYGGVLRKQIEEVSLKFGLKEQIRFIRSGEELKMFNNPSIDTRGIEDSAKNYEACGLGRSCLHMRDNFIYLCPLLAHIDHFNKYFDEELTLTKQDFIDINKLETLAELIEFLNETKDDAFCKNCNLEKRDSKLFKMVHTKYNIYEWYHREVK